ncbi:MAG: DUF1566 domain-containing protein [Spirochaetes bacterium]|nr:DUF1566 domain-containing protein [Spirochaetota bacterium]
MKQIIALAVCLGIITSVTGCKKTSESFNPLALLSVSTASAPEAPGAAIVTIGDTELTIDWAAVDGATAYEVWHSDTNDSATAAQHGGDIVGTSHVIDGLSNGAPRYVWLKAKNSVGTSGFGPVASGTPGPPAAPAAAILTPFSGEISLIWKTVANATAYEVWYNDTDNSASATQDGGDITGTSHTITGLSNGTPCYVWLKAKNVVGTSDFGSVASDIPSAMVPAPFVTGQTTCYDVDGNTIACAGTGQDGELLNGVTWTAPHFTDNGDGTITDSLTGLIWEQSPDTTAKTWAAALAYANDSELGGYTDWRLPNMDELRSLFGQYGQSAVHTWLNGQGFTGIQNARYWTGTTAPYSSDYSIVVHAEVGSMINWEKANTLRAILVCGFSNKLPKTGQTANYDITYPDDEDGDLELGVAWPSTRFTDNTDGTVTDNLTGLMWQQSPDATTRNWATALADANASTLATHADWRLPNINELESLYNAGVTPQNGWLNSLDFIGIQSGYYWTSTTYEGSASMAWSISMYLLGAAYGSKTNENYLIMVR